MNSDKDSFRPGLGATIIVSGCPGTLYSSKFPKKTFRTSGSCSFLGSIMKPRIASTRMQKNRFAEPFDRAVSRILKSSKKFWTGIPNHLLATATMKVGSLLKWRTAETKPNGRPSSSAKTHGDELHGKLTD